MTGQFFWKDFEQFLAHPAEFRKNSDVEYICKNYKHCSLKREIYPYINHDRKERSNGEIYGKRFQLHYKW